MAPTRKSTKSTKSTSASKSNRIAVDLTNLKRQNVTRLQKLRARRIFLKDLPAELRETIYKLCIDGFTSLETFFDKYYKKLQRSRDTRKVQLSARYKKTCPSILLVSRQTYIEARHVLLQKPVTFNHGLLGVGRIVCVPFTTGGYVDKVISPTLLRSVSSITVSTKGHPTLEIKTLLYSWRGYMALLSQLGHILSQGHKLKELTISIDDENLCEHLKGCSEAPKARCDYRDELKAALKALGTVRNVPKVVFEGRLPEEYTGGLVESMQSAL